MLIQVGDSWLNTNHVVSADFECDKAEREWEHGSVSYVNPRLAVVAVFGILKLVDEDALIVKERLDWIARQDRRMYDDDGDLEDAFVNEICESKTLLDAALVLCRALAQMCGDSGCRINDAFIDWTKKGRA